MSGFQMKFKKRNPDFRKPAKKVPATLAAGEKRVGSSAKPDKLTAVISSSSSSDEDFVERKKSEQAKENAEKSEDASIVERALLEQVMKGQLNLLDLLAGDSQAKELLESKLTPEMIQQLQNREPPPANRPKEKERTVDRARARPTPPPTSRPTPPPTSQPLPPHLHQQHQPTQLHNQPIQSLHQPTHSLPPRPTQSPHQQIPIQSLPPRPAPPPLTAQPMPDMARIPPLSIGSISSESDSADDFSISSESSTDSDEATVNPIKLKKRVKKLRSSNKKLKKNMKKLKKKLKSKEKIIADLQAGTGPVKEQRKANVVKPQLKHPVQESTDHVERPRESHSQRDREPQRDREHRDRESQRDSPRKHRKQRNSNSNSRDSNSNSRDSRTAAEVSPQVSTMQAQMYHPAQYTPSLPVPMGPVPPLSTLGAVPPLASVMAARPPLLARPPGLPPSIASLLAPGMPGTVSGAVPGVAPLLPTPSEDDLYSDVFNSSQPSQGKEEGSRKREIRELKKHREGKHDKHGREDHSEKDGSEGGERDSRGYPLCLHCKKFHSKNVRCRKQALQQAERIKAGHEEKRMSELIAEREKELEELRKKKELREKIKADSLTRSGYRANEEQYDIDECLDGEEYND